jgi:hypothetical protein
MSISSDDDCDCTVSDGEYDSARDSDVHMRIEDDVDSLDGIHLDGDVDMARDSQDLEDEEEKDEKEEDEKEAEVVDEDEEEDEDEDNGKEPQTIGQGQMVNTSADDADTMVDDQPTVLPEEGQDMLDHTPWPQLLAPAPQP